MKKFVLSVVRRLASWICREVTIRLMGSREERTCELCGKVWVTTLQGLGCHITKLHKVTLKDYYDRFVRKEGEGFCKTCGVETKFGGLGSGYHEYCSVSCNVNDPETKEGREARRKHNC